MSARERILWRPTDVPEHLASKGWHVIAIVCLVFSVIQIPLQTTHALRDAVTNSSDMVVYHDAGMAILRGESPYRLESESGSAVVKHLPLNQTPSTFLYPPPAAALFAGLVGLSQEGFYVVWVSILELCLCGLCICVTWIAGARRNLFAAFALVGPLAASQLMWRSFTTGQIDVMVLFGCAVAGLLAVRNRPHVAAACLASAACLKLYPVFLLLPLWRRFGLRPLVTASVTALCWNLVGFLIVGIRGYRDFVDTVVPVLSHPTVWEGNISPISLLARVLTWVGMVDPKLPAPAWLRMVSASITLVLICLMIRVSLLWRFERSYGWVAWIGTMAGAITWVGYWTVVLIPAAFSWRRQGAVNASYESGMRFSLMMSIPLVISTFIGGAYVAVPLACLLIVLPSLVSRWGDS